MRITSEDLAKRYRAMSDGELLTLNRADLTDMARQCYDQEIERRQLFVEKAAQEEQVWQSVSPAELRFEGGVSEDGPWMCAGVFRTPDEARIVRGQLESAGIPAHLEDRPGDLLWLGAASYPICRVLVPQALIEEAQGLIESQAAEQELAARRVAEAVWIAARYEDGVFRPVKPVDLDEGVEVMIPLPPATPEAQQS